MEAADVRITADGMNGGGEIVVNGVDVSSKISAWSVQGEIGKPTVVTLRTFESGVVFDGPGVVRVADSDTAAEGPVLAFLDTVDPQWLDEQVLDRLPVGSGMSTMGVALAVLRELAGGR